MGAILVVVLLQALVVHAPPGWPGAQPRTRPLVCRSDDGVPILDEEAWALLESLGASCGEAESEAPPSPSSTKAARMIAQLQSIQQRNASSPFSIGLVGASTATVLHERILELMSFALVLGGNRVLTTASVDADLAVVRGGLKADDRLLTVVIPQSTKDEAPAARAALDALRDTSVVQLRHSGDLPPSVLTQLVYSEILGACDRLIVFASHRSTELLQMVQEAQALNIDACVLFLD